MSLAFEDIVDAWVTDLTGNITGLHDAVTHSYAPWSGELMYAERGERHLAVFPTAEPEVVEGLLTDGSMLAAQTYTILVWEDTGGDQERLVEDPTADVAWLELYRAIRDRLFLRSNIRLGSTEIMDTRYNGGSFDRSGHLRAMELRFVVRVPLTYLDAVASPTTESSAVAATSTIPTPGVTVV